MLVASGQADVFLTYCTNAVIAVAEEPGLQLVDVPPAINVSAEYGLAVRRGAAAAAQAFADDLRPAERGRALAQGRLSGALSGRVSIERAHLDAHEIAHMPRPERWSAVEISAMRPSRSSSALPSRSNSTSTPSPTAVLVISGQEKTAR